MTEAEARRIIMDFLTHRCDCVTPEESDYISVDQQFVDALFTAVASLEVTSSIRSTLMLYPVQQATITLEDGQQFDLVPYRGNQEQQAR